MCAIVGSMTSSNHFGSPGAVRREMRAVTDALVEDTHDHVGRLAFLLDELGCHVSEREAARIRQALLSLDQAVEILGDRVSSGIY